MKEPKKRGRGRPPKAAQAAIAAPVADEEAEPDVQEEPEESLDVVAKVCRQVLLCEPMHFHC